MNKLRSLLAAWLQRPSGRQRLAVFIDGVGCRPRTQGEHSTGWSIADGSAYCGAMAIILAQQQRHGQVS